MGARAWRERDHPRWPAKAHDSQGGRFAPAWVSSAVGTLVRPVQFQQGQGDWRDRAGLERAVAAKGGFDFEADTDLVGGVRAETSIGQFPGFAPQVVRKTYFGRPEARNEWLVSLVGDAIGAPVPPATRPRPSGDGDWSTYLGYVPGDPGGFVVDYHDYLHRPEAIRLGLLDVLVGNTDRNDGNWIFTNDDEIVGIDHGDSFQEPGITNKPPLDMYNKFSSVFMGDRGGGSVFWRESNPLTKADVIRVRQRLETLRATFYHEHMGEEFETMLARLDKLGQFAHGEQDVII